MKEQEEQAYVLGKIAGFINYYAVATGDNIHVDPQIACIYPKANMSSQFNVLCSHVSKTPYWEVQLAPLIDQMSADGIPEFLDKFGQLKFSLGYSQQRVKMLENCNVKNG